MNTKLKLISMLTLCVAVTACKDEPTPADHGHSHSHDEVKVEKVVEAKVAPVASKIQAVSVSQLNQNITIAENANSDVVSAFAEMQENINDFSVNAILKAALEHNLLDGKAFSEDIVVGAETLHIEPALTPSIVMSPNYADVSVVLAAKNSTYSSKQTIGSALTESEAGNKQYWMDNPLILKEKIVNGLYDVANQFADDMNASVGAN